MVAQRTAQHTDVDESFLPQQVEAEAGVLGSLLIDPDALALVTEYLRADDFYREEHRTIFQAAHDLYAAGTPADLITLTDELQRRGKLDEVGGVSYVSSLANQVPTSANVEHYARIVKRGAAHRRLIAIGTKVVQGGYHQDDVDALCAETIDHLTAVQGLGAAGQRLHTVGEGLANLLDHMGQMVELRRAAEAEMRNTDDPTQAAALLGLPTGLPDLDGLLGGLRRGTLDVIAGRPSTGKTALALQIATFASLTYGQRGLFFSLEMSEQDLLTRLLSLRTGIAHERLRDCTLSDAEWEQVSAAIGELSDMPLTIVDTPGRTIQECAALARAHARRGPLDFLALDYVQQVALPQADRSYANHEQQLAEVVMTCKRLARELNAPFLLLSQMSRNIEQRQEKRPLLSDLRGTGQLEQEADVVIFTHPDPESDATDLIVAKHRNGAQGERRVRFDGAHCAFREYPLGTAPERSALQYRTRKRARTGANDSGDRQSYGYRDDDE